MTTEESSLAYRLLKAGPDDLSRLLLEGVPPIHGQSPLLPALLWRVEQPSSGELRRLRAPLLRLLHHTTLPEFAIEALGSLARSADGEELLPELIGIFAQHAAASSTAKAELLECALGDGPEAAIASLLLAGSGADLTPHWPALLRSMRVDPQAETLALIAAACSVSQALPDDAVRLLRDLLEDRRGLDSIGQNAARLLLADSSLEPYVLESCLAYFLRVAHAYDDVPEELMLAFAVPAEHPDTTGVRLAELFRSQRQNRGVVLALTILAPAECTAMLEVRANFDDGFAARLLEGLASGVAQVQDRPDWLSPWQMEQLSRALESAAQQALSSEHARLQRALLRLLAALGDTAALVRLFRDAASKGRSIEPALATDYYDVHGLLRLSEGWTQPAFWQTHCAHRVRDEDLVMLAEWYPSLKPLLA